MKKALLTLTLIALGSLAAGYAALFYANNRENAWPEQTRIRASFSAGVGWLSAHREEILRQNNPALWWMVQQSAERTQNPTLLALLADYRDRYLERGRNIWRPLFFPGRWVPITHEDTLNLDDYQLHFIYAISCDPELGQSRLIQAQLDPGYCAQHPFRPACVTHQMMAFRFMQRNDCGDAQATSAAIGHLQESIVQQLTWDPRVVDVYLQRVLMLVESGAKERLHAVWLDRVLAAQQPDGGWAGVDPLLTLPGGLSLSFGPRGLTFKPVRTDFHATAQGVMLMALLMEDATSNPR